MKQPHSQDPGYAGNWVLFLGLFDVTRRRAEMAVRGMGRWDGI